jgi:hypothetical protein
MNCLQYGRSQAGAMSAAVGFLTDQGMVPPSVLRKGAKTRDRDIARETERRDSCAELVVDPMHLLATTFGCRNGPRNVWARWGSVHFGWTARAATGCRDEYIGIIPSRITVEKTSNNASNLSSNMARC